MNFRRVPKNDTMAAWGFDSWVAPFGPWNFLIVNDPAHKPGFTVSYRLAAPVGTVSASSTIMGPFETFEEAKRAARDKAAELARLS